MTGLSQWIGVAAGLWLIGLGIWMAARPRQALAVLAAMGSNPPIHFGEMAVRALIGAAIMGGAHPRDGRAPDLAVVGDRRRDPDLDRQPGGDLLTETSLAGPQG